MLSFQFTKSLKIDENVLKILGELNKEIQTENRRTAYNQQKYKKKWTINYPFNVSTISKLYLTVTILTMKSLKSKGKL